MQAAGRSLPTVGVLLVFHLLPIMLVVVCVRLPDTLLRLSPCQKEFKASDMGEKALSEFGKDMVKSGVRSGTKMDESTAVLNRARLVNSVQTTQAAITKAKDGIQTGIRNLYTPPLLR